MSETFFDRFYTTDADYYGLEARPEFHAFLRALPGPHPRCLDLACGQGRHAIPAARLGAQVHAVDYSAVAIEQLQRLRRSRRPVDHDGMCRYQEIWSPAPETYDAAFLVSTLSHFEEADLAPLVAMTHRALAPGGRVFVEAFTTEDPAYRGAADASETAEALHHFFPPRTLADLFDEFAISEYREFVEDDLSHGPAHKHGVALLIGEKA